MHRSGSSAPILPVFSKQSEARALRSYRRSCSRLWKQGQLCCGPRLTLLYPLAIVSLALLLLWAAVSVCWASPSSELVIETTKAFDDSLGSHHYASTPVRSNFVSFESYTTSNPLRETHSLPSRPRVCIVTFAIMGPIKNGGIATADLAIAEALQEAGHEVSILWLWGTGTQLYTIEYWITYYANRGLTLIPLPDSEVSLSPSAPSKYITKAYEAYVWLRERQDWFDILHIHEWHGPGYYVALAKHQGLAFQNVTIWTTIHCPALFYLSGNFNYLDTFNNFASDYLERMQVLYSDVVVSPSAFMLKWVQQHGWELPAHDGVFVQQNMMSRSTTEVGNKRPPAGGEGEGSVLHVLEAQHVEDSQPLNLIPQDSDTKADEEGADSANPLGDSVVNVREFVFFARLEVLKGIKEFVAALHKLAPEVASGRLAAFNVTFLGNPNMEVDAVEWLKEEYTTGSWPFTMKIITDYIQPQAIAYMRAGQGRVAVLASLAENSPYTVLECLALRIPFIASNVGGIPELVKKETHNSVLFHPSAASIAQRMRNIVTAGLRPAIGTASPASTRRAWVDFHSVVASGRFTKPPASVPPAGSHEWRVGSSLHPLPSHRDRFPHVSVIVVTHDRGHLLLKTIDALMAQEYPSERMDIILVDDGSTDEESLALQRQIERFFASGKTALPHFQFVRQTNQYPGAARNNGVKHSRTSWVIFLDDDDIPKPNWLSTMASVAVHTDADVVTCMVDFFHGDGYPSVDHKSDLRWLPVGPASDLGMWHNVFGAYSALFRKDAFLHVHGFTQDYGSTFEDWELLATTVLRGMRLELVPEPLLWYRQNPKSHLMKTTNDYVNRMRAFRPFAERVPPQLRKALLFGFGAGRNVVDTDE